MAKLNVDNGVSTVLVVFITITIPLIYDISFVSFQQIKIIQKFVWRIKKDPTPYCLHRALHLLKAVLFIQTHTF